MHKTSTNPDLDQFMRNHRLPESYRATAQRWVLPLADQLADSVRRGDTRVLGIVGSQGSGKSTLADLLRDILGQIRGLKAVCLSLDDFYLTRKERQALAREVHPLLATRGVPGTHDLDLAQRTLDGLLHNEGRTAIPRFDKANDDRKPKELWEQAESPMDLVILEGWCLQAPSETDEQLARPINALEADEDSQGTWRRYVNDHLAGDYARLFARIDQLIFLKAPDFESVFNWRRQQEQKIPPGAGKRIMSDKELARFIQHFERITRDCLASLPERADVVFELDRQQHIIARHENPPHA